MAREHSLPLSRYSYKPPAVAIGADGTVVKIDLDQYLIPEPKHATTTESDEYEYESSEESKDRNTNCVPMYKWQTVFYPTCNNLHENVFTNPHRFRLVNHGLYRDVWQIRVANGQTSLALKTLRSKASFDKYRHRGQITDAILSEKLTSSKHVADIYSFCGFSAVYDFASNGTLQEHFKILGHDERLRVAAHISRGLADAHTLGGGSHSPVVHADIAVRQFVKLNGEFKLNDFNTAGLLKWDAKNDCACGHRMRYFKDKVGLVAVVTVMEKSNSRYHRQTCEGQHTNITLPVFLDRIGHQKK